MSRISGALVALAAVVSAGCVTRGSYDLVVSERDQLAEDKRRLETSSRSLDTERTRLLEEMEDLREVRERLDRDVRRLTKAEAELSANLAARETELVERSQEVDRLRSTYEGLVSDLEAEVAAGQIEIEQLRDGLQLALAQDVLFATGSAEVNASGRALLSKVSQRLGELPHRVVVKGHTDDVPIHTPRYPSNWELAGGRASHVVRILAAGGVDPKRLSVVSYGENMPRAQNDTPEGRARNRRIEIVLEPADRGAESTEAEAAESP